MSGQLVPVVNARDAEWLKTNFKPVYVVANLKNADKPLCSLLWEGATKTL